ncbi:MAG: alkaline phosphatase family protein [Tepidisphaeraceae bacterium]
MQRTLVLNVVGLTPNLIGANTPRIAAFKSAGASATIDAVLPAVTCSVQATYLTGEQPQAHGIVGNGWYFKDECEIRFWHQSDKLVQRQRLWSLAKERDPGFTCANCFWWNAMYSAADITLTPRPMYLADGRKLPDLWTNPPALREQLQRELGQFPLFKFWGPGASIESSHWIVSSAIRVDELHQPTLNLVYVPHLDYALQKFGPDAEQIHTELQQVDAEVGRLIDHAAKEGLGVILLSEYGISRVSRPIHLNRLLRDAGLLVVRTERGHELMDAGSSRAFAVADHQVAHIYLNDPTAEAAVRAMLSACPGVASIHSGAERAAIGLNHARAGDIVAIAKPDAWFTYYYWLNDAAAPDFARTVDIHRKPGYDPVELFLDPAIRSPKWAIGSRLIRRKLGFRTLLDVIPLDASLVRGSHGAPPANPGEGPLLISNRPALLERDRYAATEVRDVILNHLLRG